MLVHRKARIGCDPMVVQMDVHCLPCRWNHNLPATWLLALQHNISLDASLPKPGSVRLFLQQQLKLGGLGQ